MAKITRYNGNLLSFAASAQGSERTVFGGTNQSDSLDDNVNSDFVRGWGIVGASEAPTRQDFNAMGYTLGQLIAYLYQWGVPEWHSGQEFNAGSITNQGGELLESLTDGNIGNDPSTDDGTHWVSLTALTNRFNEVRITPDSDANVIMDRPQYSSYSIILDQGSWTQGHDLVAPDEDRAYLFYNGTGFPVNFRTVSGSGTTISPGVSVLVIGQSGSDGAYYLYYSTADIDAMVGQKSMDLLTVQEVSGTGSQAFTVTWDPTGYTSFYVIGENISGTNADSTAMRIGDGSINAGSTNFGYHTSVLSAAGSGYSANAGDETPNVALFNALPGTTSGGGLNFAVNINAEGLGGDHVSVGGTYTSVAAPGGPGPGTYLGGSIIGGTPVINTVDRLQIIALDNGFDPTVSGGRIKVYGIKG